ncbi:peptidylprolyl isomerase [Bordetella genomosp. 2]|uniref:Chaperone SurA n=1 Tax=Bordetella genomosp. 2 TaxID=1983456 RepID=A0A261VYI5_9BORD|nr:peptidylprolyl isomerase [Bordetella genomosp. 2]OZI79069.1 molecular chaperone SurA [Bordetella genomosp. 2]
MMRSLHTLRRLPGNLLVLAACTAAPAVLAAQQPAPARSGAAATPAPAAAPAPREQFVDGIAAVVNKDVITLREVDVAAGRATAELKQRGIQVPPQDILRRQVLQNLIMDRLQRQEADRLGIRVNDQQVDRAIESIAARNNIPVAQMRAEIEKSGVPWDQYRQSLSNEIRMNRLRQRTVDSTIVITDAEVDAFLKDQERNPAAAAAARAPAPGQAAQPAPAPAQSGPVQIALAQILVRVPEGSTPDQVAALRKKAEDLLARIKQGGDFASLAAAESDGPEALQGGVMGARPLEGWPDLFIKAVGSLQQGQVSGLVQSGNGFHILKVLDRSGGAPARPAAPPQQQAPVAPQPGAGMPARQGPVQVTQTHARHILIKTSTVMSDDQARQRLEQIRQRIVNGGASFADMARQYSQDANAPQGGDLGWVNPGEMVPPFEQAMNALPVGGISQPVMSPFGWHLIQVEERREHDVSDELQRMQARQILFERRAEPAFEDWLAQLRNEAYIDNRLEKQSRMEENAR